MTSLNPFPFCFAQANAASAYVTPTRNPSPRGRDLISPTLPCQKKLQRPFEAVAVYVYAKIAITFYNSKHPAPTGPGGHPGRGICARRGCGGGNGF